MNQIQPASQSVSAPQAEPMVVQAEPPDLNCKLCIKWFTYTAPSKEALDDHYATIHKGEVIPGSEPPAKEPIETQSNDNDSEDIVQVFKCMYCPKGKPYTNKSNAAMKQHMKFNHKSVFVQEKFVFNKADLPIMYSCKNCEFINAEKSEVQKHIKEVHSK